VGDVLIEWPNLRRKCAMGAKECVLVDPSTIEEKGYGVT
jgi:hypothetical protein